MPSMPRPKSRAARAAAALLSLSLAWQLAAPAAYALAEEATDAPDAVGEASEWEEREQADVEGPSLDASPVSPEEGTAVPEAGDEQVDESERLGDVPDRQEGEEGETDSTQDVPAEGEPSSKQEPQTFSAAAPDDNPLTATIEHSGEWGECSWSIDSDGLLRIWPTDGVSGRLADSRGYSSYSAAAYFPWYGNAHRVKRVVIDPGASLPVDAEGMFRGCSSLASLDVSGWDTSAVTDMGYMFDRCSSLASLDASGWDTSHVGDMQFMFYGCSSLASLDASGWDTSRVADMECMFCVCSSLASLDASGWDTSRVADMANMFEGCSSLASLDVSGWDTSSVKSMGYMFDGCSRLASLDLSGWDTSRVWDMECMFSGCSRLASLDVSGWDTSHVGNMYSMFDGCSSLASLDLSSWDTSSLQVMDHMFYGCSSLASLDLSSWDTSRVGHIYSMFDGCDSLSRISVGERYDAVKAFPEAPGGGRWRSEATGRTYTATEVASGRRLVADTYTLAGNTLILATVDAIPDQAYTGKALEPRVTVRLGSRALVAGTDYTVSYSDNTSVGTATVTVTGKGDYTGAKSATFRVVPASLAKATIAPIPRQLRTGKAVKPPVAVTLGGRTLVAGTDYTVSYSDNVEAGTATVTVTGKGNYEGAAKATFEIVERPATVEVYRLYNKRTSEHLWTTSANEYKQLPVITKGDWRQEGVAWMAPDGVGTPVYRLYNKKMGDHYYSMSKAEIDALTTKHGWTVDNGGKPAFWSAGKDDAGVSPLFCVYNRRLKKGQHHFTADKNERDFLVANAGWRYEKEAFYGYVTKK